MPEFVFTLDRGYGREMKQHICQIPQEEFEGKNQREREAVVDRHFRRWLREVSACGWLCLDDDPVVECE